MEEITAAAVFSALGHEPRLQVYLLLVEAGPDGMAAGDVARATRSRPNTLSSNLAILSAAGLVSSRRNGRSIVYSANHDQLAGLFPFINDSSGSP